MAVRGGAENLQKHSVALQAAERLDPAAVQRYRGIESPHRNRYVIDAPLPEATLRARAQRALGDLEVLRAQFWERFADWLPLGAAPWVPLTIMALMGATWAALRRRRFTLHCGRCGGTVCARCYPELSNGDLCIQCHHIYLRGAALDPKLRLEKEAQIHRHHSRWRRVRVALSAIVMGAGQVLAGRSGRGIALLALFFFVLLQALFWNGIVRYPVDAGASPSATQIAFLGLLFLPAYLLGLAGVLKR
jgi:TM2 domain-containing membrane protein YozV